MALVHATDGSGDETGRLDVSPIMDMSHKKTCNTSLMIIFMSYWRTRSSVGIRGRHLCLLPLLRRASMALRRHHVPMPAAGST